MRGASTTMLGELMPKLYRLRAVIALHGAIEAHEASLAISPARRQVLQLHAWAASARNIDETATSAHVRAACQTILGTLRGLAKQWWPGSIRALRRDSTPAQCGRRLHLKSCTSWQDLAETATFAAKEVADWADNDALSPPPCDADRLLANICTQTVRLRTESNHGDLIRPEHLPLSLTELERLAGELRWIRGAVDERRWGDAFGRLRWAYRHLASNNNVDRKGLKTLHDRLDGGHRPRHYWALELDGFDPSTTDSTGDATTAQASVPLRSAVRQTAPQEQNHACKEIVHLREQVASMHEEQTTTEGTLASLHQKIASLHQKIASQEQEITAMNELLEESAASEHTSATELRTLCREIDAAADRIPKLATVADALNFAAALYDDRLVIHSSAQASAKKSRYREPRRVFDVLVVIALTLSADLKPQIKSIFGDKARYKSKDSEQTLRRFKGSRTWPTSAGGKKCYGKHITLGHSERSEQCLQIYFDRRADGKYEIAWVGAHRPTVSHNT